MLSASVCVCVYGSRGAAVCECVCERQALRNLHMLRQMNWLVNEMKPNCKMTASSTINSHLVMRTHTPVHTHTHVPAHTYTHVGRSKSYCEWLSRYAGSMSLSKDALTCLTCPRWPQAQCGTRRRMMRLRIRGPLRRPLRGQLRIGIQYY